MPLIASNEYKPPLWLRNGHINTFYPYFFRKKIYHNYQRQRVHTPDADFFDVDWLKNTNNKRLVILLHGLEGSSQSQYIMGSTHALSQHQFDIAAINFRSCSGEMNSQMVMYHSGWTKDVHHFLGQLSDAYDEIFLVGFSLGGNVVMKYVGDGKNELDSRIKAVVGVSVPCDLKAGSIKIRERQNHFYEQKFIETLLEKIKIKHVLFPNLIDINKIKSIKTLWDFDDVFTASLHGFRDAVDYYDQSNSLQYLKYIELPSLMVNALDDTFLPESSYPFKIAEKSKHLFLMTPKYGGHVGFTTFGTSYYWIETVIIEFLSKYSSL